jgi:DNA-binding MarR family transcriptional regulator
MERAELVKAADRLVMAVYEAEQRDGETTGNGISQSLGLNQADAKQAIKHAEAQGWVKGTRVFGEALPIDLSLTPEGTRYVDTLFGDRPGRQPGGAIYYNVTGNNARINIGSHDNSTNVVNVGGTDELFDRLEQAIREGVADASERERVLASARELRATPDNARLSAFLQAGANVATIINPFLPALALLVAQGQ